ncbi:hypothetical protein V8E55_002734 [Tylopilus felleus]
MQSPATTSATTTGSTFITPATTPAISDGQNEHKNTPDHSPTKPPVLTQDFYLDTFFNPVWTSGPHVFSFAQDGTVVRPQSYASEPYPGYHADRARRLEPAPTSHFQGFQRRDPKPWKNVAITEQDDAEWEEMRERARVGAVGEYSPYYRSAQPSMPEQPELVYTWPPRPHGQ